jgi:hypothetical protein
MGHSCSDEIATFSGVEVDDMERPITRLKDGERRLMDVLIFLSARALPVVGKVIGEGKTSSAEKFGSVIATPIPELASLIPAGNASADEGDLLKLKDTELRLTGARVELVMDTSPPRSPLSSAAVILASTCSS